MKIGTKSTLFGAHCFLIHPIMVFIAWWKLYGFPWDPRLWIAFFVHDLGYWGKPNMDGDEGINHIEFGAKIMGFFDHGIKGWEYQYWQYTNKGIWWLNDNWTEEMNSLRKDGWKIINIGEVYTILERPIKDTKWSDFSKYHSRVYAGKCGVSFSRLCVADKLAVSIEPKWLYLPRVKWTGEIKEYMEMSGKDFNSQDEWEKWIKEYLKDWAYENRDNAV